MTSDELIPKLVRACLDNDRRLVEELSTMLTKLYRKKHPDIAADIARSLTCARNGDSAIRSVDVQPVPIDRESRFGLCKAEEPLEIEKPILVDSTMNQLLDFVNERHQIEKLIMEDITPPSSLLFVGEPGVGKTYSARWLSYQLGLPLVTMDLATSISSYLGRTGQNIKSIFDYAKSFPSVLLLDEIDAIAKRRDDASDLGELKRLVNVLLKELESWPSQSVIIAATNHPELLDKALWRRFDRVVRFSLPGEEERRYLMRRELGKYYDLFSKEVLSFVIRQIDKMNAADISKMCMHVKRKIVLDGNVEDSVLLEVFGDGNYSSKADKIKICRMLKEITPSITVREISRITKISTTSVSRYLQEG